MITRSNNNSKPNIASKSPQTGKSRMGGLRAKQGVEKPQSSEISSSSQFHSLPTKGKHDVARRLAGSQPESKKNPSVPVGGATGFTAAAEPTYMNVGDFDPDKHIENEEHLDAIYGNQDFLDAQQGQEAAQYPNLPLQHAVSTLSLKDIIEEGLASFEVDVETTDSSPSAIYQNFDGPPPPSPTAVYQNVDQSATSLSAVYQNVGEHNTTYPTPREMLPPKPKAHNTLTADALTARSATPESAATSFADTTQASNFFGEVAPAATDFFGNTAPATDFFGNTAPAADFFGNTAPATDFFGNTAPATSFFADTAPATSSTSFFGTTDPFEPAPAPAPPSTESAAITIPPLPDPKTFKKIKCTFNTKQQSKLRRLFSAKRTQFFSRWKKDRQEVVKIDATKPNFQELLQQTYAEYFAKDMAWLRAAHPRFKDADDRNEMTLMLFNQILQKDTKTLWYVALFRRVLVTRGLISESLVQSLNERSSDSSAMELLGAEDGLYLIFNSNFSPSSSVYNLIAPTCWENIEFALAAINHNGAFGQRLNPQLTQYLKTLGGYKSRQGDNRQ